MAKRENHYEAAFEEFLRRRGIPYLAIDETRRSLWGNDSLKNLDFIVSPIGGPTWLVDVKGRQFPSGEQKRYWKNWSERDDLLSLTRWERIFGPASGGLFVFAYNVLGDRAPVPEEQLFRFRDRVYGFVGITLAEYMAWARPISPKWNTLAVPVARFRRLAAPLEFFLGRAA
jgi:hypothetical protein